VTQAPGAGDDLLARRLRAQRLSGPPATDVATVVRTLTGVQAQDPVAAALAIRARSSGLTPQPSIAPATRSAPSCGRGRCAERCTSSPRRTPAGCWACSARSPRPKAARAGLALGLDDERCERGLAAIRAVLDDAGPLTRAELVARLRDRGVTIDASGQAPAQCPSLSAYLVAMPQTNWLDPSSSLLTPA